MDKAVTGGRIWISSLILSFLSFAISRIAHRRGSPGSTGRRVETALLEDPSAPTAGHKNKTQTPKPTEEKTSPATSETQHLPFSGTGLPKVVQSCWTAKYERERKRAGSIYTSPPTPRRLFLFCVCFLGFAVFGVFLCPAGFCLILSAPLSAITKTPRARSEGNPHPGDSGHPASPQPRKVEMDPHQPEPLLSPSENTDAGSSARAEDGPGVLPPDPAGSESSPADLPIPPQRLSRTARSGWAASGPTGTDRPLPRITSEKEKKKKKSYLCVSEPAEISRLELLPSQPALGQGELESNNIQAQTPPRETGAGFI